MSETSQPADGEIETRFFWWAGLWRKFTWKGGTPTEHRPCWSETTRLVRFVRYGMVSPTLVVLIDGLPVPFQAWTR